MTDDELRDEALAAAVDEDASRARLVAEVRRLRGLVKAAEAAGCNCGAYTELSGCPWCHGEPRRDSNGNVPDSQIVDHAADCPAFTPDGAVR